MAKLEEKEMNYLKDIDFLKRYLSVLSTRLVYTNNLMESDKEEMSKLYEHQNALTLSNNIEAFELLLQKIGMEEEEHPLTEELIKQVANTINRNAMYIKNDYRELDNGVAFENQFAIEKPSNIDNAMKNLLEKYYKDWSKLDIFEREALFNIEFLRIHPFEDGNGRTSRLLLNFNLLRQEHAPVLIPKSVREEYFKARNREDSKWIKLLFEKESLKEKKVIDSLIEQYQMEKSLKVPPKL